MITKTALENIVSKQRKMLANVSPGHPREIEESIPYLTDRMLLIGGVRGCGCSALLHRMLNNDYPEAWYTDFDDPRLGGFDAGDFTAAGRVGQRHRPVQPDRPGGRMDRILRPKNPPGDQDCLHRFAGNPPAARKSRASGRDRRRPGYFLAPPTRPLFVQRISQLHA